MWKDVSHQLSEKEKSKMNTKCMKGGFNLSQTKECKFILPIRVTKITKIDKIWN